MYFKCNLLPNLCTFNNVAEFVYGIAQFYGLIYPSLSNRVVSFYMGEGL